MKREDVIELIRKLREHNEENGATQAEALAFALKAQRLMAEWEIGEDDIAERGHEVTEGATKGYSKSWASTLASVVAVNFRCRVYMRRVTQRKSSMVFVGYEQDQEAARIVFERLFQVGDRLAREYADFAFTDRNAYRNFAYGFVMGAKEELERQSQALMIVVPSEVNEYYEALDLARSRSHGRVTSAEGYDRGRSEGRDAVRAGRMSAPVAGCLTA